MFKNMYICQSIHTSKHIELRNLLIFSIKENILCVFFIKKMTYNNSDKNHFFEKIFFFYIKFIYSLTVISNLWILNIFYIAFYIFN